MKHIFLGLAIHNHQPVGNLSSVFQQVYEDAYLPLAEALERHPGVRLSLHYSGSLLDWLLESQPSFVKRVAALVKRGQAEIMTGGYYEPILAAIPEEDKIGQIRKLTEAVRRHFGYSPSGLWLAERVWEPHLAAPLYKAGAEWTIVDDSHFKLVGLGDEDLFGYYVTEEAGLPLKLYATSKRLRYTIPWAEVDEVLAYLGEKATEEGTAIAVMGDDGEKFGSWPATFAHCWTHGWVERFFSALEQNAHWLTTIPLGEYARRFPALGRVYLPTASYAEMQEWALPPKQSRVFQQIRKEMEASGRSDVARYLGGGFWRSFLVKYPEINVLHKKMFRVHEKVYAAREASGQEAGLEALWHAQCNCPYWHGVFGGVYLNHIRQAMFRYLIEAEEAADAILQGDEPWITHKVTDFDRDGRAEALVESKPQNIYLAPERGGAIFEWDLRAPRHNLGATLTRRPEAYHFALEEAQGEADFTKVGVQSIHEALRAKEPELAGALQYDWYQRASFVEHFLAPGTPFEAFTRCDFGEKGNFVEQPYEFEVRESGKRVEVCQSRQGQVWCGPEFLGLRLEKILRLTCTSPELQVWYQLTNISERQIEIIFGSEWNLSCSGGGPHPVVYQFPDESLRSLPVVSPSEFASILQMTLTDPNLDFSLSLELRQPATVWSFPIETISNSEGGMERVFQGVALLLSWPLRLEPGATVGFDLVWRHAPASH